MLSMQLLRRIYPQARISLLTDTISHPILTQSPTQILTLVDDCQVVPLEQPEMLVRSRELKTRARCLLEGDFVFIDSDALPIRPFAEVFAQDFEVAAVLDRNSIRPFPHFPDWFNGLFDQLGWARPTRHYFDSGLVFWKDTPGTRRLSQLWTEAWRHQQVLSGRHFDQPSFNHVLDHHQAHTLVLDVSYNAMLRASPWFGKAAKILHFHIADFEAGADDLLGHLLQFWQKTGQVDWAMVERVRQAPYSLVTPPDHLGFLLGTGHYRRAARLLLRKLAQALKKPAMIRDFLQDKLIRRNRTK